MKKPLPFGKYYLLERINVGGMAEVFRAKAYGVEGFERLVAVKRILPNIAEDKEFIKMFIDEAKIAVQLNHANIAQIFDLGMVDTSYYIALEHIHGRDLRAIFDRCRNHGQPMPVAQACFVTMKVCEGLDYAHNKRDQSGQEIGLVHRDVSPQNVLVSFEGEVKIIDFGIAKAAGKGSKTQAGILKGKFGYMSPEQVRGLPIDRRSDVFACGIVLYELLTGERLFVGESDFSTLEKVRNVEILPPGTYNRKIPDELERIVLKALAKDVDDRYQNAIDLHDELQAFVYTAGEFYSRKDLAAWMKKKFAEEIQEESQKLEAYRRLRPPEAQPATSRPPTLPSGPRRSTLSLPSVAKPPPVPGNGRRTGGQPMVAAPGLGAPRGGADLEWDDDELETQIYDNPADELPGVHPPSHLGGGGMHAGGGGGLAVAAADSRPTDLSSLVQSADGWSGPGSPPHEPAPPPANLAAGSSNTPSPFAPSGFTSSEPEPPPPPRSDPSAVVRLVGMAEPIFESESAFAASNSVEMRPARPTRLYALLGVIALLLVAGGVVLAIGLGGGKSDKDSTKGDGIAANGTGGTNAAAGAPGSNSPNGTPGVAKTGANVAGGPAISAEVLASTGFDLFIEPAAVSDKVTIKLDGKISNARPPVQIRKLTPGDHKIEVTAPSGFFSKTETVTVVAGQAGRVTVRLSAIAVTGTFVSEPPGALVVLVVNGTSRTLGKAPRKFKLDPSKTYEVSFKKRGYVTQTRPIEFSGGADEKIAVVMEKATVAVSRRQIDRRRPPRSTPRSSPSRPRPDVRKPKPRPVAVTKPKPRPKPSKVEYGTIGVASKPLGCQIYISGRNVGKTPKRGIKVKAGRTKVTLVCNEHGIRDSFTITVKPGPNRATVRNLMSKISK